MCGTPFGDQAGVQLLQAQGLLPDVVPGSSHLCRRLRTVGQIAVRILQHCGPCFVRLFQRNTAAVRPQQDFLGEAGGEHAGQP